MNTSTCIQGLSTLNIELDVAAQPMADPSETVSGTWPCKIYLWEHIVSCQTAEGSSKLPLVQDDKSYPALSYSSLTLLQSAITT